MLFFFSAVIFGQFLVIKALDPDPYWIWIGIQPKMLNPYPDEMNADPQPCLEVLVVLLLLLAVLLLDLAAVLVLLCVVLFCGAEHATDSLLGAADALLGLAVAAVPVAARNGF
jgi:hypothetical protein